jgi:anthranilate synthase / indole-3-glycerol phosphate synthase / phosphoribosylanthranilate isomerase
MSSSQDILAVIGAQRCIDVDSAKKDFPLEHLEAKIARDFPRAPIDLAGLAAQSAIIAAEFKRASPSKGLMVSSETLSVEPNATAYVQGGAHLLSVLTEPKWFKGQLVDMEEARRTAEKLTGEKRPAVLRKDFVIDHYQIYEARAFGADTLLLIVSLLPTVEALKPLIDKSRELGMEPLVEVNSTEELEVAISAGSKVVGVNNRNLRTFVVDMGTTARVVAAAALKSEKDGGSKPPVAILSLSGLKSAEDIPLLVQECIEEAKKVGASEASARAALRGFLIGEALMRASEPQRLVSEFVAAATSSSEAMISITGGNLPLAVKICGVKQAEDALIAARNGADFIGMIMVKESPRYVGHDRCTAIVGAMKAFREQDPSALLNQLLSSAASAAVTSSSPLSTSIASLCERWELLRRAARKARPLTIGVFMNQSPEELLWRDDGASEVDAWQLHGKENAEEWQATIAAGSIKKPILKVIHVPIPTEEEDIAHATSAIMQWCKAGISGLLLDTAVKASGESGGTGTRFDHAAVLSGIAAKLNAALAAEAGVGAAAPSSDIIPIPIVLAGGLTPETVGDAVRASYSSSSSSSGGSITLRLAAVDVSSGVEVEGGLKGIKEEKKVVGFIRNAKEAGKTSTS